MGLGAGGSSGEQGSGAATPFETMMRQTMSAFTTAWARGDVDGLMTLFGDNPIYRMSSGALFKGRGALRDALVEMCKPPAEPDKILPKEQQMHFFGNSCLAYWTQDLPNGDRRDVVDGVDVITFDSQARVTVKDAYRKLA